MLNFLEKLLPKGKERQTALSWMWLIIILGTIYLILFLILSFVSAYNRNDWGQLGDTVGGVLNPFFAFLQLGVLGYIAILVAKAEREKADEHLNLEINIQRGILVSNLRYSVYKEIMQVLQRFDLIDRNKNINFYISSFNNLLKVKDNTIFIYNWEQVDNDFKILQNIDEICKEYKENFSEYFVLQDANQLFEEIHYKKTKNSILNIKKFIQTSILQPVSISS